MENAEDFVRNIWHEYLETRDYEKVLSFLASEVTVIGTGKDELSGSREAFEKHICKMMKWDGTFSIEREWYQTIPMTTDFCLVFGEIYAKENTTGSIAAEMDMRISVICKKENAQWKLFHSHQSVPNSLQQQGEFFPQSIIEQSNQLLHREIEKKAMELEEITQQAIYNARCDQMTGLLNRISTEGDIETCLKESGCGTLFMIDVDNFKQVNDHAGHLTGDRLLVRIAGKLRRVFGEFAIIGRMGGDEFVAFLKDTSSREEAVNKAELLLNFVQNATVRELDKGVTLSIGIAFSPVDGSSFEVLWNNADKAMYDVKHKKKNSYSFYQDRKK